MSHFRTILASNKTKFVVISLNKSSFFFYVVFKVLILQTRYYQNYIPYHQYHLNSQLISLILSDFSTYVTDTLWILSLYHRYHLNFHLISPMPSEFSTHITDTIWIFNSYHRYHLNSQLISPIPSELSTHNTDTIWILNSYHRYHLNYQLISPIPSECIFRITDNIWKTYTKFLFIVFSKVIINQLNI